MSDQNRTYTSFELNRRIREGHRVEAEVVGYPGEHRVLRTRMAAFERMQAQVTVAGHTFWRNMVSVRVEEKEVKVA
jgi:hypothetical protein